MDWFNKMEITESLIEALFFKPLITIILFFKNRNILLKFMI
jgi:hypothetical protein